MALNKTTLANNLFDAETANVELTKEAEAKIKKKCKAMAQAIDDFVKSVDIVVDIPPITVGTPAGPGTTSPSQGTSSSVF